MQRDAHGPKVTLLGGTVQSEKEGVPGKRKYLRNYTRLIALKAQLPWNILYYSFMYLLAVIIAQVLEQKKAHLTNSAAI